MTPGKPLMSASIHYPMDPSIDLRANEPSLTIKLAPTPFKKMACQAWFDFFSATLTANSATPRSSREFDWYARKYAQNKHPTPFIIHATVQFRIIFCGVTRFPRTLATNTSASPVKSSAVVKITATTDGLVDGVNDGCVLGCWLGNDDGLLLGSADGSDDGCSLG